MTAKILRFPSRGTPRQLGVALAPDQLGLPKGDIVKVVGLHGAGRENINGFQYRAARHLWLDRPLDPAHKALVDSNLRGELSLSEAVMSSPLRQLHSRRLPRSEPRQTGAPPMYVTTSYFVNGHGERLGAEYVGLAYVLVMHPGNRLRELRKIARLTQEELAQRTGFAQDRISNYENGRRPMRLVEMRVLARELGCASADLLDDGDNPERLSDDERALLQAFRDSPATAREFLLTSARAVAERHLPDAREAA